MAGQNEFLQAISELERLGESNEGRLTLDMIGDYFSDMNLDSSQMDSICKYLQAKQIVIEGWIPDQVIEEEIDEVVTVEDPLDQTMVDLYIQETAMAASLTGEQEMALIEKMVSGDASAASQLIEGNLSFAIDIAKRYQGKGMQFSDLIQESNIALMLAVADYVPGTHGDFHTFVEERTVSHLLQSIEEYNGSTKSAMKMADKINALNDATCAFVKEYGREGKPEEIAKRMGITEEEVRDLMKISLDAISVIE